MQLSNLICISTLYGVHLYANAIAILPSLSLAAAKYDDLVKRIVIEPAKVPKVVVSPGGTPKLTPGGVSCARSWLRNRACTVPVNPGSPGSSSSGDTDISVVSTYSERLAKVNTEPGLNQFLAPETYVARGKALLEQNQAAIDANPRVDTVYDDWNVRYFRDDFDIVGDTGGFIPYEVLRFDNGNGATGIGTKGVLEHPDIGLNSEKEWNYVAYTSKADKNGVVRKEPPDENDPAGRDPEVSVVWVDTDDGALIAADSDSANDFNHVTLDGQPVTSPPRLYNSELIYQAWRDVLKAVPTTPTRGLQDLKYIVRMPVMNAGTRITIKDAYNGKGLTDKTAKATFLPTDTDFQGLLGDAWSGIMGTVNGRPTPLISTDHAASLNGLQIVKIHEWYEMPGNPSDSALVFEMGHAGA